MQIDVGGVTLIALKHYETHNGEKKFIEDYGNDR